MIAISGACVPTNWQDFPELGTRTPGAPRNEVVHDVLIMGVVSEDFPLEKTRLQLVDAELWFQAFMSETTNPAATFSWSERSV